MAATDDVARTRGGAERERRVRNGGEGGKRR